MLQPQQHSEARERIQDAAETLVRNRFCTQGSIQRTSTARASKGAGQKLRGKRSPPALLAGRPWLQKIRKRASSSANFTASEKPISGRTLSWIRRKDIRGHKIVPIWLWRLRGRRRHYTRSRNKVFPQQPKLYMAFLVGRSIIFRVADDSYNVPGRGLEPLRISPPDPKSGASANSATLAGGFFDSRFSTRDCKKAPSGSGGFLPAAKAHSPRGPKPLNC